MIRRAIIGNVATAVWVLTNYIDSESALVLDVLSLVLIAEIGDDHDICFGADILKQFLNPEILILCSVLTADTLQQGRILALHPMLFSAYVVESIRELKESGLWKGF